MTDTGVGIPDAARAKIFQEFFQVDQTLARRQGGTGLGLAIASRLARIMGGDITLESVVGAGSRFTFTLPQSRAGAVEDVSDSAGDVMAPAKARTLEAPGPAATLAPVPPRHASIPDRRGQ